MDGYEKQRIKTNLIWKERNYKILTCTVVMCIYAILTFSWHATVLGHWLAAGVDIILIIAAVFIVSRSGRNMIKLVESGTLYEAVINPGKTFFYMRKGRWNSLDHSTSHDLECFIYDDQNNRHDFKSTYTVPLKDFEMLYDREKLEEANKKYDKVKLLVDLNNTKTYYVFHNELLGCPDEKTVLSNGNVFMILIALFLLVLPFLCSSDNIAAIMQNLF